MSEHEERLRAIEEQYDEFLDREQVKKLLLDQKIIKAHTAQSVELLKEIREDIKEMKRMQQADSIEINASIVTATKTALSIVVAALIFLLGVAAICLFKFAFW